MQMHGDRLSKPAWRRIGRTVRVGLVTIEILIAGHAVALSQDAPGLRSPDFITIDLHPNGLCLSEASGISSGEQVGTSRGSWTPYGPGGPMHALSWHGAATTVVDLHPSVFTDSEAHGTSGAEQVGFGDGPATGGRTHALLWRGSAASVVDLHPRGFDSSEALATSGGQQVGWGNPIGTENRPGLWQHHAVLWRGSAGSVVDLHPNGFTSSEAHGISGAEQVGFGTDQTGGGTHALLWRGSAGSVVDLHPNGFTTSAAWGTSDGQQVGSGSGPVTGNITHALLWRGSAGSMVDLNPPGFWESSAVAASGTQQVGSGQGVVTNQDDHALLWRGSAISVVDLHTFLPSTYSRSWATGIDATGNIVGFAAARDGLQHAFLWKRDAPMAETFQTYDTTPCQQSTPAPTGHLSPRVPAVSGLNARSWVRGMWP